MEYGEMMRQFRRFCAAQEGISERAGLDFQCEGCPLDKNSVCDKLPCAVKPEDVEKVERVVEKWVEEHPEPVYPTWGEYLEKVIPHGSGETTISFAIYAMQQPIHADIAQMLGIGPKEG